MNLIKNELFKLNHRTEIRLLFVFVIISTLAINLLNFILTNNETLYQKELDLMIASDEEMMNSSQISEDKVYYSVDYEMNKLKKNYKYNSPETVYINETITVLANDMYNAKLESGEDSGEYLAAKKAYDEGLKKLENFDWKQEVKDEIKINQETIDILNSLDGISDSTKKDIEFFKEKNRVLNYRLDNNIAPDNSNASEELTIYLSNLDVIHQMNSEPSSPEEKNQYNELVKEAEITKYKIDNNLLKANDKYTTVSEELVDLMSGNGFMLTFMAIFVAAIIISAEFDKGTIKQLLIRPYTRTEIWISKIIATILFFLEFTLFCVLVRIVIVGILAGFNTIANPIIVYNYNTGTAYQVNLVLHLLKCFALVFPKFLISMLIVNLIAVNTKSAVLSIYVGLMLNVVNLSYFQKPISRFIVSNCWDFNIFANGATPLNKYIELGSSIAVVVGTAIIAIALSIWTFKRKEIKNQ